MKRLTSLTLITLTSIMFTGCFGVDPSTPSINPKSLFPTYDTSEYKEKESEKFKNYPATDAKGNEIVIYKKAVHERLLKALKLGTKDYNILLNGINTFNIEIKKKEAEYNKRAQEDEKN